MLTLDQQYAISAHQRVTKIKEKYLDEEKSRNKYGSTAHKLPILIRTAGLAQALAFVETRGKNDGKDKDGKKRENPYKDFLQDLEATVGTNGQGTLAKRAREAELEDYMLLTQQVLHALLWYKRFAQSILDVDASTTVDDGKEE